MAETLAQLYARLGIGGTGGTATPAPATAVPTVPAATTPATTTPVNSTKAIQDAYKNVGGYAGEKAGVDWWSNYASTSGDANWLDKLTSSLQTDATKSSTKGLKSAQSLLGFTGDTWDNASLTNEQKQKLVLDGYKNYGFMAPDEEGMNRWMSNFDTNFGDFSFADDWDKIFADPEGRANSLALRGEQEVYGFAEALAELMGEMPAGGGAPAGAAAGGGGLDAYLNPYLESVLGGAIGDLTDSATLNRNRLGSNAFAAGAYGDGRHGVESASLTSDMFKNVGELSNTVRAQGHESAMGWKNTDIDRQMAAAFQNAGLENQWFNNNLNAASTGSNIANNNAGLGFQYADMLTGLDSYDRNWLQQELNSDYEDFWAQDSWDANQMQSLLSLISGVPGQQTGYNYSPNYSLWEGAGAALANPAVTNGLSSFLGKLFNRGA